MVTFSFSINQKKHQLLKHCDPKKDSVWRTSRGQTKPLTSLCQVGYSLSYTSYLVETKVEANIILRFSCDRFALICMHIRCIINMLRLRNQNQA